ncbi:MAG: nicotinate-nucleotide adenylyltransferase [Hyphomonas sp.]|uniref:nicotinate-nucleotide adenylyltransferase n=1 Tax=Hyphomonas sp. TaxID=87 RepID=UPI001792287C|nr:nicotinate-nucleotide adenylyltransferase [Hyphomonas sp.]MBU3921392.1 nicotinate-nucleotide adenylyltransferase [Alphaproteobacteria bacterium]MBA3070253.1 nicotinate-nucleotide adenylyltransferase [Hyphomonas sp.]MBU4062738.1 nicotinate-nucleotide adenylyltransferase [Alphaproteobacteria bacterium]MBU4163657.1 nicotinate-nucleotide adenylyltransferase [Alphaproteobacteria bacterium]MBU4567486.1 nicotinate-nucleotide adenylyltransferase [Alphaproteobacteria bacterium]
MKRARLPGPAAGRRIGLLGGSFNPAHAGHLHVAETALRRLRLDSVWWIVARGNPLKTEHGSFGTRFASAQAMAKGPAMHVTAVEQQLGLTYTIDTLRALRAAAPTAHFVWIMGADSAAAFHLWKDWKRIAQCMPIAVVSRPGTRLSHASSFTRQFAAFRIGEPEAARLPDCAPPAWIYLRGPDNPASSTTLRRPR